MLPYLQLLNLLYYSTPGPVPQDSNVCTVLPWFITLHKKEHLTNTVTRPVTHIHCIHSMDRTWETFHKICQNVMQQIIQRMNNGYLVYSTTLFKCTSLSCAECSFSTWWTCRGLHFTVSIMAYWELIVVYWDTPHLFSGQMKNNYSTRPARIRNPDCPAPKDLPYRLPQNFIHIKIFERISRFFSPSHVFYCSEALLSYESLFTVSNVAESVTFFVCFEEFFKLFNFLI
jgi:hypothetical protein